MWTDLARPCDIFVDHDGIAYVVSWTRYDHPQHGRRGAGQVDIGGAGGHAVWADSRGDLYIGHNQEGRRLVKLVRQ